MWVEWPPSGGPVLHDELQDPVKLEFHCHRSTCTDVQSGRMFCDQPAVYRSYNKDDSGSYVQWCEKHLPDRFRFRRE